MPINSGRLSRHFRRYFSPLSGGIFRRLSPINSGRVAATANATATADAAAMADVAATADAEFRDNVVTGATGRTGTGNATGFGGHSRALEAAARLFLDDDD